MKEFSVLSENYITNTRTVKTAAAEVEALLGVYKTNLNNLLEHLFVNDDLSTKSPEYFEFKSHPFIKSLLKEDYGRELSAIIFESKKELDVDLKSAVKCAHCVEEIEKPTEHDHSEYDKVNNLFGFDSQCDDDGLKLVQTTVDIPTFHDKVKKLNDVQEEAKKEINEAMSNIGKYDKDVLASNFEKLLYVKTFLDSYK